MSIQPRLLEVGRVTKPHGIKGEVVVQLATDRTERLAPGSVLHTQVGSLEVRRSYRHGGESSRRALERTARWIVAFAGVASRTEAEALRGTVLQAPPVEDPAVLWVHQLVGCEVVDPAGRPLGRVTAVQANPASDLLVLDGGELVPSCFVVEHSAAGAGPGRLVVDAPAGLLDLA